jgi:transforming growth factor-beta-induced protein
MKRLFLKMTAAAAVGALVGACGGTDDGDDVTPGTLLGVASRSGEISAVVAAAERAGMNDLLSGPNANLTMLAPTNEAFGLLAGQFGFRTIQAMLDALPADAVRAILEYHVLPARVTKADLLAGGPSQNTLLVQNGNAVALPLDFANNEVKITDTIGRVGIATVFDVPADNGLFHLIDRVLIPAGVLTVLQTVQSNPERFRRFAETIGAASPSLATTLNDAGTFTLFGPVNAAFTAAEAVLGQLEAAQLTTVMQYHALPQRLLSSQIAPGAVTTLAGQTFTFAAGPSIDDTSTTNANITAVDILASNGVVHVIDKVLIPALT